MDFATCDEKHRHSLQDLRENIWKVGGIQRNTEEYILWNNFPNYICNCMHSKLKLLVQ